MNKPSGVRKAYKLLTGCDCPIAEPKRYSSLEVFLFIAIIVFVVLFFFIPSTSHAYSQDQAIRAIIGEASNQGYTGMLAVAEVIRHRGSVNGLYGLYSPHVDKEPLWVWKMARKALYASANTNITKGANHFENIHAFGVPNWAKDCIETFRYKDHVFYVEVKGNGKS